MSRIKIALLKGIKTRERGAVARTGRQTGQRTAQNCNQIIGQPYIVQRNSSRIGNRKGITDLITDIDNIHSAGNTTVQKTRLQNTNRARLRKINIRRVILQ